MPYAAICGHSYRQLSREHTQLTVDYLWPSSAPKFKFKD